MLQCSCTVPVRSHGWVSACLRARLCEDLYCHAATAVVACALGRTHCFATVRLNLSRLCSGSLREGSECGDAPLGKAVTPRVLSVRETQR